MTPNLIKEQMDSLDVPIATDTIGWLKQNKLRIIIINEDYSYKDYYVKYPNSYIIEIKKRSYVLIPECILRGKIPTVLYYYNNPYPLTFKFEYSTVTALSLRNDPEQLKKLSPDKKIMLDNINIDAEALNLAFNTRVMRGLYAQSGITVKGIIIILIVVFIIILIMLQLFGVVDIYGLLTGGVNAVK